MNLPMVKKRNGSKIDHRYQIDKKHQTLFIKLSQMTDEQRIRSAVS